MLLRSWYLVLLALLMVGTVAGTPARAESWASAWGRTEQGAVRLIAAPGPDGVVRMGLAFKLEPHWKIYWRSPGDAGLPPTVDWAGSQNALIGDFRWPVPERFELSGLETFGYEGEITLPLTVTVPQADAPVHLQAAVDFLTCRELCVPNDVVLDLVLPPGLEGPGPYGDALDQADARVPGDGSAVGLTIERVSVGGRGKSAALDVTLRTNASLGEPDAIVEGAGAITFGPPMAATTGLVTHLSLPVLDGAASLETLVGKPLTLTIIDRSAPAARPRAATGTVTAEALVAGDGVDWAALLAVIALALLGGFILNFMPCVLPVLSIKLLALVGSATMGRRQLRAQFLATAAGILTSFLIMAATLIAAKSAGLSVGWGIQFQQPMFLAGLAALVTLFACNLMGWFEITLPWWLAGRLQGGGGSLVGSFLAGAFATLLATPCSAPFLGTAVGFALAGGPADILLVFACLGIGLAMPYLAVAALPGLARLMPRPGRWMLRLRQCLGLLLAATALWLILILAEQAGPTAAILVAGLAIMAAISLALRHRRPALQHPFGWLALMALLAMLVPPRLLSDHGAPAALDAGWVPFESAGIGNAVARGQVVFVDVTARWCLTCQVNERLVLDQPAVRAALDAKGVVAMRADWTRPDPAIAAFLKRYGRYGIPFNIVYGPGAPDGVPLSEVLSVGAIEAAFAQAKGPAGS